MKYKQMKKGEEVVFYHSCLKIVKIIIVFWLIGIGNVYSDTNVTQQNPIAVSGFIKDQSGEPIIGVSVSISGRSDVGTVTDVNGKYRIDVPANSSLLISYIGFKKVTIPVGNRTSIDITLEEDTQLIDEVVIVGYGTQKKVSLTGAVSSIKGEQLISVKNENVQNMITGRLPGVRVWQRSAEPGAFDTRFDIRGMGDPLIIIDGVPRTMQEFQRFSANDIDDISILKDGSAAIYGLRAANGVVLVTTKVGGKKDKPEISYSGSYTLQYPSGMPKLSNAADYMTRQNWARQRNRQGEQPPQWSLSYFDEYASGERKSWDWNEYMWATIVPETQHNLSISGGNGRTNYYVSGGYLYQNSFFSTNDRNYDKFNVMTNLNTKIYDNLTFDVKLSAIADERNEPNESAAWTIRDYWRMNPTSLNGPYADVEETMLNNNVVEGENPFTMLHSDYIGWRKRNKEWFDGTASLTYDVPWIKGMSLKGLFGYNFFLENYKQFAKRFYQYQYNETDKTYSARLYPRDNQDRFRQEEYIRKQMISQFVISYNGTFDKHKINAMLAWEAQKRSGDNFWAQRYLLYPQESLSAGMEDGQIGSKSVNQNDFYQKNNNGLIGRLNYNFSDKYLAEFLFRYDGSSMFAPGHQWGFFPGGLLAWRVSEEEFFKNTFSFIDNLKLRASYAQTGDDSASQYQFMVGYDYPVNSNGREFSNGYVIDGSFYNAAVNKGISNPNITWYTANTYNLGVDFEGWKGLFGFTLEYFNRERSGLLARRTGGIPTVVGAGLPQENIESDRQFGLELVLTHKKRVGDFFYKTSLMGTVSRRQRLDVEERTFNSSWDRWRNSQTNRYQGIYKGFLYTGQYQNWNDIWNDPVFYGMGTLPGDYRYLDWNGDGEISDGNDTTSGDIHPVRFAAETPLFNYSLNFEATWKRFELNILFHGAAGNSMETGEIIRDPQAFLQLGMDMWHTVDYMADPYIPSTQWVQGFYSLNGDSRRNNSTFLGNVVNTAFLRLKNIELGYNLPNYKSLNWRLFVSGYNVFTLSKARNHDPEHPGISENNNSGSWGFMYPMNKTLTFGLTINF